MCRIVRSKCHTVNIFSSARVLARYGSQTAKQCFCAKGHSPGWAGMDLSRGIKPRPAMKPPKRVRTADQLFRICTHRRDRYRDPAFEVKLCAACRTQQVVCKSSRSKRRGARCIGDRVGVLPNGSMHPDVPASTFVVVKLTGGLRTTSSPPVLPESQAVGRGVPPYSETRRTCPRMACADPQPTGIRAI